jgi:hypothetical protein
MTLLGGLPQAGCPACIVFESDEQWCGLALVAAFPARDLFRFAKEWAGRIVEVRECARCGRHVARVVAPRSEGPETTEGGS